MINTFDFLQNVIDYIEDNLKNTLTLEDLSIKTNISKFHLSRIFKALIGISPIEYIRRRRLTESINDLLNTNMKIIDISLEYNFKYEQSYIRSFTKLFGITPDKFRREKPVIVITEKYDLSNSKFIGSNGIIMIPTFVFKSAFNIIGIEYYVDKCANRESHFLSRYAHDFFYKYKLKIQNQVHEKVYLGYVNFENSANGFSHYTTAVETKSLDNIPEGMVGKAIPSRKYAVFKYIGLHSVTELSIAHIQGIYDYIYFQWIRVSNYTPSDRYHFEAVTEMGSNDYCELDIYIPIKLKEQNIIT